MKVYVVQAENSDEPEHYMLGVFDTKEKAMEVAEAHRIPEGVYGDDLDDLLDEMDLEGRTVYEYAWFTEVDLNTLTDLSNR